MRLPPSMHWISRGWLNANQLLLTGGEGPVLIDTGHIASTQETFQKLHAHGVVPSDLVGIVNTHAHLDHFGGNRAFRNETAAPLLCSPQTAQFFADHNNEAMWLHPYEQSHWPQLHEPFVQADRLLHAGEEIRLGEHRFQVIAVPGHAPDMIALFQPDTQVLVCSDAMVLGDCTVMNTQVWPDALEQAIDSLKRLRSLDARVALPGHGPVITDVNDNIDAVLTILRKLKENPEKNLRHSFSRATMFFLLVELPLPREAIEPKLAANTLLQDYAEMMGVTPSALASQTLDSFLQRGALTHNNEGWLEPTIQA